ncbi:MAG: lamin tail domain-containing protein [Sumerlaeia bacterium]
MPPLRFGRRSPGKIIDTRPSLTLPLAVLALGLTTATATAGDVILQYFEGSWQTIERRMPDVFMAGYDVLWVPPPSKADSGGFSVGYDVFDRFNLGSPNDRTLYGTESGFRHFAEETDRAGVSLTIDTVLNHNGFRDGSSFNFEINGGYPGFVTYLSTAAGDPVDDPDGDFHSAFSGGDLEGRLAGLIDINQSKNYQFIRHPVPGFGNNIPRETPRESNRQFYPDQGLPQEWGRHPFNLADPLAGDPVAENSVGLLLRYVQWMSELYGVDGFRLDAVKHVPTWFWNDFYDGAVYNLGRDQITGSPFTPFSFGEAFTGDFSVLSAYTRKDGFGNRDVLDFPLFFAMDEVFNAGGFGDMHLLEHDTYDAVDGNPNDGTRGVMFAGSHDEFGPGQFNGYGNLPHAFILTRAGFPVVYYNAKEFGGGRDFPKDGRGDALGNFGSGVITNLVGINDVYAKNSQYTRFIDSDLYIYERLDSCIVGINDRGDSGYDERGIDTGFAPGTVLVELTGFAADPVLNVFNDIPQTYTVAVDGRIGLRVPRNSTDGNFHGRGFVVYGPAVPDSTLTITNASGTLGPDPDDGRPEGTRRLTTLDIVSSNTIEVQLDTVNVHDAVNDGALVKLNYGLDIDGTPGVTAGGEFNGFDGFPNVSGAIGGPRSYTISIDATGLSEGYHYLETIAFRQRPANTPSLYDLQRKVIYLDRLPPTATLAFPTQTGSGDILTSSYEVVVDTHETANSVHILTNVPPAATDGDIFALLNGDNKSRQHDRTQWRQVLSGLTTGTYELTVVAFEETGNYSITRFDGIDADVPSPEVFLGYDADPSDGSVDFQPLPSLINDPAYPNDLVVRVRRSSGMGTIDFPADYSLTLQVDDSSPISAQPYNASLLPPLGVLVQNDQNLGDDFEEFRFLWRGYGTGNHTIRAVAELTSMASPPNEVIAFVDVDANTPGPSVVVTSPTPPATQSDPPTVTLNQPNSLTIEGLFQDNLAQSARIILDLGGDQLTVADIDAPASGPFTVTRPVSSYLQFDAIESGAIIVNTNAPNAKIRVQAATGPNLTGILSEATSAIGLTGYDPLPQRPPIFADGAFDTVISDGVLLASSPVDGGFVGVPGASGADFGGDGSLTEMRGLLRDNVLYIAVRGDMFGGSETNIDNGSFLYVDTNAGSSQGAVDIRNQLNDFADGLRGDISNAAFVLSGSLQGAGIAIDLIAGITAPGVGFGYALGSSDLPGGIGGSFTNFAYREDIVMSYGSSYGSFPAGQGATIQGPDAFLTQLPLLSHGSPDLSLMRFAAVTSSDAGYASPNMLPENPDPANPFDAFPNTQTITAMTILPFHPAVRINEIFTGSIDFVELYNPVPSAVDLGGWTLVFRDSAGLQAEYVFPSGTLIGASDYLVLSDEGGASPPAMGTLSPDLFVGFNIPWEQDRSGSLALLDDLGKGMDYLDWQDRSGSFSGQISRAVPYGTFFGGDITGAQSGAAAKAAQHSLARDVSSTDTDTATDWENTSGINSDGPSLGAANAGEPLWVDLISFTASATNPGEPVRIAWETGAEVGTIGFYIHRAVPSAAGNGWVAGDRVNTTIVPSLGSPSKGANYEITDPLPIADGETRGYFLIEVETQGFTANYGPAFATSGGGPARAGEWMLY